jgi:hypothetical protein
MRTGKSFMSKIYCNSIAIVNVLAGDKTERNEKWNEL